MPRLLLVDDNPSIHKIAETLLAATDFELVCLESGDEALRRVLAGERFDVALLDTAMAGMDGWELLERLRQLPTTAGIPIAMMAGVLDTVDPARISGSPIQGFLKKPVELRDLGDRLRRLLEEHPQASAADTIPAAPLADLVPAEPDLLVLGPEDLWPEPEAPVVAPAAVAVGETVPVAPAGEEPLELEELDFETLQGLQEIPAALPPPAAAPAAVPAAAPAAAGDAWADEAWEKAPVGEPTLAADEMPFLVTADELPDLGDLVEAAEAPTLALEPAAPLPAAPLQAAPQPAAPGFDVPIADMPVAEELIDASELSLEEELDLGLPPLPPAAAAGPPPLPAPPEPVAEPAVGPPAASAYPAAPAAVPFDAPAAAPAVVPAAAPTGAPAAWVQALLADPQALDALAQALAGRLSDKALREVAWEVMPELAERLRR